MAGYGFIYGACRKIGLEEEEDRRDYFERVTGKRSLRTMTTREIGKLERDLRKAQGGSQKKSAEGRKLSGPYAAKLQALWIAAYNLGLTTTPSDTSLMAFVSRQCGIDHANWVRDPKDALKVIEALKAWFSRERGIIWTNETSYRFLNDHAGKVAWAIWCQMHPYASLATISEFEDAVKSVLCSDKSIHHLNTRQWQSVCNAFGKTLRGEA